MLEALLITMMLQTAEPRVIAPTPVARQISLEEGMPSAYVLSVYQDASGFIWVSTVDGLVRLEGRDLTVLRHNPDDPDSLPTSYIHQVRRDRRGKLWAAAADIGLVRLSADLKVAEHIKVERLGGPLPDDHLWNIAEDCSGRLWLAFYKDGLVRYDPETGEMKRFTPQDIGLDGGKFHPMDVVVDAGCRLWMPGVETFLMVTDTEDPEFRLLFENWAISTGPDRRRFLSTFIWPDGTVWLGTTDGIYTSRLNAGDPHFGSDRDALTRLAGGGSIVSLVADGEDRAWAIGTSGLLYLSAGGEVLASVSADDNSGLPSYRFLDGLLDDEGTLWLGSLDQGVIKLAPNWRAFNRYLPAGEASGRAVDNRLTAAAPGRQTNTVLFARAGAGIERLDLDRGELSTVFMPDDAGTEDYPGDEKINGLLENADGTVWLTTRTGLFRIPRAGGASELVRAPSNLESGGFRNLWPGDAGRIWIQIRAEGLMRLDPSTGEFEYWHAEADPPYRLAGNEVRFLTRDETGVWWLSTRRGLHRSDDGVTFEHLEEFPEKPFNALHRRGAKLWLAGDGSLEVWDMNPLEMNKRYTVAQGLPSGRILDIHEDERGVLWLPMSVGLTRFDPLTERFRLLGADEGARAGEFLQGHNYINDAGALVAATSEGLVVAHPADFRHEPPPPRVHIRRMWAGPLELSADRRAGGGIELPYDHNTVQFDLLPITYLSPDSGPVRMQLVGWDEHWIHDTGISRQTYSRLPPGNYRFQAQAASRDGQWGEFMDGVEFVIHPPPWRTVWAYLAYALAAVLLGALLVRAQRRRRERRLQLEAARQASQAKSDFLAMISHEIRTPMHGVMGMVELLGRTRLESRQRDMLRTLHRSGVQLLSIVNDTLDLSRIEAGHLELERRWFDLPALLDELVELHAARAAQAGLDLYLLTSRTLPLQVAGDPLRLSQILGNLLSNAIKFTRSGWIQLSARDDGAGNLVFAVTDTGPGMTRGQQDELFIPFTQLDTSITRRHSGTGLGLAICRRLSRAMGGDVGIQSTPGVGSRFTLTLPLEHEPGFALPTRLLDGGRARVLAHPPLARAVCRILARWGVRTNTRGGGSVDWAISEAGRLEDVRPIEARKTIILTRNGDFEGKGGLELPVTERRLVALLLDDVVQSAFIASG